MRNKHLFLVLSLVMMAVLALSACAPPAAPAPAAEQPAPAEQPTEAAAAPAESVTITWAFWGSPEEAASHKIVADAFMAEHPEIKIELWNQPWDDYFTKIQTLWASGDSKAIPDVAFLWPTPRIRGPGRVGKPRTRTSRSPATTWTTTGPACSKSAKYEGSVYGFPRDIEVNVLYYNKDLFDKAGVAYPTDTWTWKDLLAAAEKLTVKDASGNVTQYALAMENNNKYDKWVNQNGGAILDDYVNPSKCMLADPKSVEAVKFFADMMANGNAMRDADLNQAGGDASVFPAGQAAMIIQNTSRVSAFNTAGLKYDVVPVPIPEGGKRFNSAGGAAWVMSAKSDNKDAAWTFIEWLQSTNGGEKIYTERGEIFPALQSVANSPAFMTDQPPANKQGIITEAKASGVGGFGYFPEWGELQSSVINPGLDQIWTGAVTPEQGLADLCKQVDQFLKDNGYPK